MWYVVIRTSLLDNSVSPHPRCVLRPHGITTRRVMKAGIAHDLPLKPEQQVAWMVELKTLKELMDFQKECRSEIIVKTGDFICIGHDLPSIEIYDDYRE